jgi:hypothetical protein
MKTEYDFSEPFDEAARGIADALEEVDIIDGDKIPAGLSAKAELEATTEFGPLIKNAVPPCAYGLALAVIRLAYIAGYGLGWTQCKKASDKKCDPSV